MRFLHHDFAFELNDDWWISAGMRGWKPLARSYPVDQHRFPNAREICLADIAPVRRQLSHGVFNNDVETGLPARDRVINILRGFLEGGAIPPVEVVELPSGAQHPYSLTHGAHRLYLSIAAGFTHVSAVEGLAL
jgi:hypothetical protein